MELLHQPQDIIAERYRIIDILGQGGSATTYQAEDLQSGQQVALKALSLHRMTDWKMLELFEREAKILSQLKHPAIPRYLDYFQVDTSEDRAFYIVQQLAPGKSLAALVQEGWHATEEEVRRIAQRILGILVYLQSFTPNIIHRDIKPQNIIRREDGQVFLVDFGAVQATYYNTFMRGSTVVGTFGYMPPEQFIGQAVPATDLYGLGATLLFLLTHRSPAELPTDRLKMDFRSRVQISEEFADWLEKVLEPDASDRFPSAKEALAMLRGKPMIAVKSRSPEPWKAIVGVGVVAVVSVSAFIAFNYKYSIFSLLGIPPIGVYEAVRKGDVDTVKQYLEQGGKANASDDSESTLLHRAALSGWENVAKLLIAKGANVNAQDREANTPLHLAVRNNLKDVAELLITKGADVNAQNTYGDTPLLLAARNQSKDVTALLIAQGADVNTRDREGVTPLLLAARNNWKDMAELLIAKVAYVNTTDIIDGATLLHWAARNNWKDIAELLIVKGADVNTRDREGITPLHWAARRNSKDVSVLLIAKGADVNAKDRDGYTPLLLAARRNSKDVAALLIAQGADVNARDKYGTTLLDWVVRNDSKEVAELLKSHSGKK